MLPALGLITKSSPKLSCVHNLNWLIADKGELDPHAPAPQASVLQPVPITVVSRPTLTSYAPSVPEPPFPESEEFAVTVLPEVSFAVMVYTVVDVIEAI